MFSRFTVISSKNNDNFAFFFSFFQTSCFFLLHNYISQHLQNNVNNDGVSENLYFAPDSMGMLSAFTGFAVKQLLASLSEPVFHCVFFIRFHTALCWLHKKHLEVFLL